MTLTDTAEVAIGTLDDLAGTAKSYFDFARKVAVEIHDAEEGRRTLAAVRRTREQLAEIVSELADMELNLGLKFRG